MSHGIMELDKLVVGFTELYGNPWHMHPNCKNVNGEVSFADAEEAMNYQIYKVPVVIQGTDIVVPGSYALIRRDNDRITVVHPSVGERYTVIQNTALLSWVEAGILVRFSISLESAGTLLNGQKAFVNMILNEHVVPGDDSKTVTRMMYSNSFGLESYQACVHTTRIVCDNTQRIAMAQGAANKTLRKFRHTVNVVEKIEAHMVDLAEVIAATREYHSQLDVLAKMPVTSEQVKTFLDVLFPIEKDDDGKTVEGRGTTRRNNQREAILKIFEEKDDLQGGIARTRYSLLQACTDWADHDSTVRNGDDKMGRFWDGIWGTKDKFKQLALEAVLALR